MTREISLPSLELLSIDDEAGMRAIVTAVGELAGYRCHEAGKRGEIATALDREPDVVVLDMVMPDMDGIEVIRELARRQSRAALVILSGFDVKHLDTARDVARNAGLDLRACLSKPVAINELRKLLEATRASRMPTAG